MAEKLLPVETLGPDHTGLILFDTLHGYLHPGDDAKAKALAEWGVLENLQRLVATARELGILVFYTHADRSADGSDSVARLSGTDMDLNPWGDRARSFLPRLPRGSAGAAIAAEVAPRDGDVMVPKHRWNAFFQTHLELSMRSRGLDTVIIAGGSTDVGIAATAFAARDLDFGLVVARDACFAHRGPNNDFFMDRIFPRMGRVMTVDEVCALIKAGA